jgi:hypothetical protein
MTIIFTAPPTLLHKIIQWFTGSVYTHVMLGYTDSFWGGKWTAAADLDGVRLYQATQTCKYVAAEYRCKFDPTMGITAASKYINQSYDFWDLFAIGWTKLVWRLFKRKVRNPWHDSNAQICSEFVTRFLKGCGLSDVVNWDVEATTPGDVQAYCDRHPELFERI